MSTGNGKVALVTKKLHTFNSKAEVIGFSVLHNQLAEARAKVVQCEKELGDCISELGISGFDTQKIYRVDMDTLELTESDTV